MRPTRVRSSRQWMTALAERDALISDTGRRARAVMVAAGRRGAEGSACATGSSECVGTHLCKLVGLAAAIV